MDKNYLKSKNIKILGEVNKSILMVFLLIFIVSINIFSKESYSELFIKISDAKTLVKNGKNDEAKKLVIEIRDEFKKVKNSNSVAGEKLQSTLNDVTNISETKLKQIATELLAFEKEQNPVDEIMAKKNFENKMYPALKTLQKAIETKNVEAMKEEYKKYNNLWTRNEWVIRDKDVAYYGKVETAMSFLRGSMEVEPFDYNVTISNFNDLKKSIEDFIEGKTIATSVNKNTTLKVAIKILEEGLEAFKNGDKSIGQLKLKEFIVIWPTVEGDVSTRNSALYTKVESETPIIMVKGGEKEYQNKLQNLITELLQINTKAEYNFLDAMWILLREGVEALLIVLALVSSLKASKLTRGLIWVYTGGILGIVASGIIAYVLQKIFPAVSAGTNREILEGFIGIFAVIMMIGIGMWLHSKSNLKSWNHFMQRQMKAVATSGSFISMFALSFLAVFREGAETILFYVGIIPLISMKNLILGIVLAIIVLIIITIIILYTSSKIKVYKMFFLLTWMIYLLAFKMLGTSVHMLQVVGIIPLRVIPFVPTIESIGVYANWEVFTAQLIFVLVVTITMLINKKRQNN